MHLAALSPVGCLASSPDPQAGVLRATAEETGVRPAKPASTGTKCRCLGGEKGDWRVSTSGAVTLLAPGGDALTLRLHACDGRQVATVLVDGLPCHFERVPREECLRLYRVDGDPDYTPMADEDGYCYVLVPFSA
jgi:hypothetical protein